MPATTANLTTPAVFPGPACLGRGLVIEPGGSLPGAARSWPRLSIDHPALENPDEAVAELDALWRARRPSVVELAVPLAGLKQPETCEVPPYELGTSFAFQRERLHFLIWVNRYDGRATDSTATGPRWHHVRRAMQLGASPGTDDRGDILLPDGTPAWIDGGPRHNPFARGDGHGKARIVHVNQVWAGVLQPDKESLPRDVLAADQAAAVRHAGGPACVLAPAGSGKTRVLTARLRHLLADRGWASGTVTALAYNNRAAAEMRARTRDIPEAQVRTLHSFGYEILGRVQRQRPRLLDERQVRNLLQPLVPARPRANDDVYAPYLEALADVRAALRSPIEVEVARHDAPGFADVFDAYRHRLHRMDSIDHDEQIYGAVAVLLKDPEVRRWAQRRCSHLLVDELQDLTPAQLLLVRLLGAPAYDVYGVGDDDQVIYGYAGADPRFLVDYDEFFPGATRYLLETNYRCPPAIVEATSNLLQHNRQRVAKATRPALAGDSLGGATRAHPTGALAVSRCRDTDLGRRLLESVHSKLAEGASPSHIAVLTRVNAGLLAPQMLLNQAGVPVVPAVDERMLDRSGIRAALAWLRLALAAGSRQSLDGRDLAEAGRRPSRRLSRGVLGALGRGEWPLRRIARFADGVDDQRQRAGLQELHADLDRLGRLTRSGASTARLLVEIRDSVDLGGALGRLDAVRSSANRVRGGHVDDLNALMLVAQEAADPAAFEPWLRQALGRAPGYQPRQGPTQHVGTSDGIVLSTVHRAKGLEWPHVVIWDASDGVMPHHLNHAGAELEEERRVFHVAMTRAQRTLTVLARAGDESPFVTEMATRSPP